MFWLILLLLAAFAPPSGTSPPTATSPPSGTSLPTISGTPQTGDTLTASAGSWTNNPTSFGYQWQACDVSGLNCSNVTGATSSSYTLASSDVDHTMRAVVNATNAGGSASAVSAASAVVTATAPGPPSNTAAPVISGSTVQGQSLSAGTGTWTASPTSFTYQWKDCDAAGNNCTNASGATGRTYTLGASDIGQTIRVDVTATNSSGSASATSAASAVVASSVPSPPSNTAAPMISGSTVQGQTLSATNGSWSGSPTSYSDQWQDCAGSSCTNIGGATSSSYTLGAGDVSHTIDVVVTATNAGGSAAQASAQTATVTPSSGGGTPTNCVGVAGSGTISYASLDACGYPSPNTTGVPSGTSLTSVSSIDCSNTTINAVSTSGSVSIGNNCIITNSRMTGGQITVQSGITGVEFTHDEISGPYTGSPTSPTCTSDNSYDVVGEGAASGLNLNDDYLHCAAEPFNGNGIVKNSYVISDECWGPCGSDATTHNEAMYIPGGDSGGTDIEHNTILNPWPQTAGIFGDDHAWGPIENLTINNNLVASGGDGIDTGCNGDGNTNIKITNNRLSYTYNSDMPPGGENTDPSVTTWSGNYRDDTLATIGEVAGC